ncbi:MAG: SDR family oxidoreductase [Clostridiales bacterium]|jgi:3-oxoacyl-[acyl-carrier protein] reductase|nr:SDR family oxidoreductase [Clostridiales bacterium]
MLKSKTVLITGARTGIGRAVVQKFVKNGAAVVAHMRVQDDEFDEFSRGLAAEYGTAVSTVYFDIADTDALKREMKALLKSTQIDVLVNNAGIAHGGLFQMTKLAAIREVFDVNLFSQMEITQLVLGQMTRRKSGAIVNVASISGIDIRRGDCAYGVSKAAFIAFTKALSAETGTFGVRVNAVAPGFTDTKMVKAYANQSEMSDNPMKRLANTDEIANAIYFLASDDASFINGSTLVVDGGGGGRR